jgi:putative ABC transport system permease protein
MNAIDRKLWRDVWDLRGQAAAIALVMACGVGTFVMSLSTLDSLQQTRTLFYQEHQFAEVFAAIKRAPENVAGRLQTLPGVQQIETRVVAMANLTVPGFDEPVQGQFVSIPDAGPPQLNQLYMIEGRPPEPYRDDEIVVSDGFAEAHSLTPGSTLDAVINGRYQTLQIVGVAISPEFIFQMAPGSVFPDFERFGVIWMGRSALATAYDMEGAFNDVTLTLAPGASPETVIDRVDAVLDAYGARGAIARADQLSHNFLSEEFRQLQVMATILPIIFLGVAAFLLNVVVNRLVSTQREQIAVLKAFGYSNAAIGWHFVKMVLVIAAFGLAAGIGIGVWLGQGLSTMYMEFYRFPYLEYLLNPRVVVIAVGVSAGAAIVGTLQAVRDAALLPPAEAMRPEPPETYRETVVERIGLKRLFDQPSRMIIRHLERRPFKALLTVIGIAFACAVVILGRLGVGSISYVVDIQYRKGQGDDLMVHFIEPTSAHALYSLRGLPGVDYSEPFRNVPVRLRHAHRSRELAIDGVPGDAVLRSFLNTDLNPIRLPPDGLVLTDHLREILGVQRGDSVTVEVLDGAQPIRTVPIAGFVEQYLGLGAYMEIEALNRLLREGPTISGARLAIDDRYEDEIVDALEAAPRVAGITSRQQAIDNFNESIGENWLIFALFITFFAGAIAFGVVYNSARIALSERGRELASLRILGFTRGEISYILLGELAVLTLAAIPLGFVIGWVLGYTMLQQMATEMYRIPLYIQPSAYAVAAVIVIVSAVLSGLIVRRRLNRLDLIEVLKTRE